MNEPQQVAAPCCAPFNGPPAQAIFPKSPEAPARARTYVRDVLGLDDQPLNDDRLDDVLLIVSELVTNAYRHGLASDESLLVAVLTTPDRVRVEVHDPRHTYPLMRTKCETATNGRGLRIVDELAERWGTDPRPGGKAVWAEVAR